MRLPGIALVAGLAPLLLAAQAAPVGSVAAQAEPVLQSPSTPKTSVVEPKTDAVAAKATEVVCKKFGPPIGSLIGRRQICRTKAQWDYIHDQEQEEVDRVLRKPLDIRD